MPRPNGSSTRWRKTRALVISRDGYRCRMLEVKTGRYLPHLRPWADTLKISKDCTGGDRTKLEAHHVKGQAEGDDPRYLITSCKACNLATGNPRKRDATPKPVTRW